jgi:hypothetical protein
VKRICRYLSLTLLLLCCLQLATAQSLIDVNVGFGGVNAKATGNGIEGDYTLNALNSNPATIQGGQPCLIGSTPTCAKTGSLSGFMMGFGANLMLWKHFGVGIEATLQPGKPIYASIPSDVNNTTSRNYTTLYPAGTVVQAPYTFQSRTTFYDVNGIYQPVNTKRATLQLIGGIGAANTKMYENQTTSGGLVGSSGNSSQYAGSSNHLNLHAGAGVQIYLTDHMYIRPQFDVHYVPNLAQFGTKIVTQGMVWIGYTIGDR